MRSFLEAKQQEMLEMLEEMVNMDSGSYDKQGVDRVGTLLAKSYDELGFRIEVYKQTELGDHLLIKHRNAKQPKIIIIAHMDTVFPKGTVEERPFSIKGDQAFGPGVIDMKGSHITLFYAIRALLQSKSKACENIMLLFNSDEEIGSPTSREMIEKEAIDKDFALIMEPARRDGSLVTARRGKGNYTLTVKGKAAHSGIEPEKGRSAIEELAHKVIQLHELTDHEKGISVNVGLIEGGSAANTVSDNAIAHVDVRISELAQVEELEEELEKICSSTEVPGTEIELEGEMNRPPMEKNEQTVSLLELIESVGKEIGVDISDTSTGGGSDASFTAALGIPTIDGLGPVGGFPHSEKEYLEIPSLVDRALLLAKTIEVLSDRP
ncbi:M20 family metallopeptidase [Cytobacillus spongiae]|uniref:M20 family metallopeptidase n=1 Tax=Cytobacillus spongiae TaxID=2901381 RepID=UPI001F27786F|nr:M20 family metallopeptidase [Cytobacillus spongiae]UII54253.1 M20 family metallopeptidase [Cytobacillus spongiae]